MPANFLQRASVCAQQHMRQQKACLVSADVKVKLVRRQLLLSLLLLCNPAADWCRKQ
jgi:hypothetical protein